jgi:anti-sigma factor RsiW
MSCPQAEWLDGYFDGELDAARAAEFEAHLPGCAACAAALARHQALRDAIGAAGLYAKAPASLRTRVAAPLESGGAARSRRGWAWRAAGLAAVAAMILFGVSRFSPVRRDEAERVVAAHVLDAHLRSLQLSHLTDVASTDQHTVKPWFDGKLDFAPPVTDLASDGFPLLGGRLDVIGGRSVAALVYGRRKHVINLFVWPADAAESVAAASGSARGYQWASWSHGGMRFWVVSDVAAADLEELARLLRR